MAKINSRLELNDQERQILDYLENCYTGAKMVGDVSAMTRLARAIHSFLAEPEEDADAIFTPSFQEESVIADIWR